MCCGNPSHTYLAPDLGIHVLALLFGVPSCVVVREWDWRLRDGQFKLQPSAQLGIPRVINLVFCYTKGLSHTVVWEVKMSIHKSIGVGFLPSP